MRGYLNSRQIRCELLSTAALFVQVFAALTANAAVYRWDNGELITEKDPEPWAYLGRMDLSYADLAGASLHDASFKESDLTRAHLMDANLTDAVFAWATLTDGDLSGADLTGAAFFAATLTDADLSGAVVNGASFKKTTETGFTAVQLYSTASYQGDDLSGIVLAINDLSGWDFAGKNLTDAAFWDATLTDADLSGATVAGASFSGTTDSGFRASQLYSTVSYQSDDLSGIGLEGNNLSGWDFAGKNLTGANFREAILTDADLSGANLTDAGFWDATLTNANLSGAVVAGANFRSTRDSGFTAAQLYSTASYQSGDLSGLGLEGNDLSGWDFAGENLTGANFREATLTDAEFSGANLTNANFAVATLANADLSGAVFNGADFSSATGFTAAQLYSTASYQSGDLSGIRLEGNDLSGRDFGGKNLTGANFREATLTDADLSAANLTDACFGRATLTDADLSGAIVTGAGFGYAADSGFTAAQLYSTASYQSGDLSGIELGHNHLSGWDFSGKNLSNADFRGATLMDAKLTGANLTKTTFMLATLTGADFSEAIVKGADFAGATNRGFTAEQLYSTASYRSGDLRRILLGLGFFGGRNDLSGWNFAGKNLSDASFHGAILNGAVFSGANLRNTNFEHATLTGVDFSEAIIDGAYFRGTTSQGFTAEQLYSTASYRSGDLCGISFGSADDFWYSRHNDLSGWDFAGKDLSGAMLAGCDMTGVDLSGANVRGASFHADSDFAGDVYVTPVAVLADADLTGAVIDGVDFSGTTLYGLTADQVYSTASYQGGDLRGITFGWHWFIQLGLRTDDLSGWDFSGKNLTDAAFADPTGADFSFADLRGARTFRWNHPSDPFLGGEWHPLQLPAPAEGAILSDGRIEGLELPAGEVFKVWDYNSETEITITVKDVMDVASSAGLKMIFEDDQWGSTISFEPGIDVSLDGTLELTFHWDAQPLELVGTTFDLFDWEGANVSGTFDIVPEPGTQWDTSNLYTIGEVTLVWAVPEPETVLMLFVGGLCVAALGWRRRARRKRQTAPFLALLVAALSAFGAQADAATFQGLGLLPGGSSDSWAMRISADSSGVLTNHPLMTQGQGRLLSFCRSWPPFWDVTRLAVPSATSLDLDATHTLRYAIPLLRHLHFTLRLMVRKVCFFPSVVDDAFHSHSSSPVF